MAGHTVDEEVPVTAEFDSFRKTYFLDLAVNESVVIELKTVKTLVPEHDSQLLNYLLPLIKYSSLQAIHWINIAHDHVTFATVS